MDVFKVLVPGAYTTVQDLGRFGYQQFGIPPTGSLDHFASRVANLLVGNPENAAVLEATIMGPRMEILAETDIAVTGAEAGIMVNDQPHEGWSSFRVKSGDILSVGQVKSGCRSYISVRGGVDVPVIMGSRSCYVGAKLGGYEGRILTKGDILRCGQESLLDHARKVPKELVPAYGSEVLLRAIPGPQDDFFDQGMDVFFNSEFTVSSNANRMGYRLEGPTIVHREDVPKSIISEPSLPGGVQIPPDGRAIILLVEQTVGGYTKIATVVSTDIPRVAQAKPGDKIRFEQVDLDWSHEAFQRQKELLQQISKSV